MIKSAPCILRLHFGCRVHRVSGPAGGRNCGQSGGCILFPFSNIFYWFGGKIFFILRKKKKKKKKKRKGNFSFSQSPLFDSPGCFTGNRIFFLRIDNGDFCVIHPMFTLFLISLWLYNVSSIIIHQIKAEILRY